MNEVAMIHNDTWQRRMVDARRYKSGAKWLRGWTPYYYTGGSVPGGVRRRMTADDYAPAVTGAEIREIENRAKYID